MEAEFEKELELLESEGLMTSVLRLEYEEKVRSLRILREHLLAQGYSVEIVAKMLHAERRQLGKQYKNAAPPLFLREVGLNLHTDGVPAPVYAFTVYHVKR